MKLIKSNSYTVKDDGKFYRLYYSSSYFTWIVEEIHGEPKWRRKWRKVNGKELIRLSKLSFEAHLEKYYK